MWRDQSKIGTNVNFQMTISFFRTFQIALWSMFETTSLVLGRKHFKAMVFMFETTVLGSPNIRLVSLVPRVCKFTHAVGQVGMRLTSGS